MFVIAELVPDWSTHVGNNTVLEDDVVFLHKQEELAVARGLGQKPVAQVRLCFLHVAVRVYASHASELLSQQHLQLLHFQHEAKDYVLIMTQDV